MEAMLVELREVAGSLALVLGLQPQPVVWMERISHCSTEVDHLSSRKMRDVPTCESKGDPV